MKYELLLITTIMLCAQIEGQMTINELLKITMIKSGLYNVGIERKTYIPKYINAIDKLDYEKKTLPYGYRIRHKDKWINDYGYLSNIYVRSMIMNERRIKMYGDNVEMIELLGPKYTWAGNDRMDCMLIREEGCIKVDFYPHTGKWKYTKNRKQYVLSGGAGAFIKWYGLNNKNIKPNQHIVAINTQRENRTKQLFNLGLKFDGSLFNSNDGKISVSHLDIVCYTNSKWDRMIKEIKEVIR